MNEALIPEDGEDGLEPSLILPLDEESKLDPFKDQLGVEIISSHLDYSQIQNPIGFQGSALFGGAGLNSSLEILPEEGKTQLNISDGSLAVSFWINFEDVSNSATIMVRHKKPSMNSSFSKWTTS